MQRYKLDFRRVTFQSDCTNGQEIDGRQWCLMPLRFNNDNMMSGSPETNRTKGTCTRLQVTAWQTFGSREKDLCFTDSYAARSLGIMNVVAMTSTSPENNVSQSSQKSLSSSWDFSIAGEVIRFSSKLLN
ncbi:hypothetical protein DNTS_003734 [Danionella cerebrum]|uniref:Uncharacterized protein n=1 Tax=Danionella cerebrum TaxID=2873325 RepID=A0A553N409_9TELE|nr:hypothetical protein DNTS_003734 [Danionella translucida]